VTEVECDSVPLVPVIVRVYVPGDALVEAEIVRVDAADPPDAGVTDEGLNDAVTPAIAGEVTLSETAELKPLTEATVMVDGPDWPVCIDIAGGDAEMAKSGEVDEEVQYSAVSDTVPDDVIVTGWTRVLTESLQWLK
jgi:hypothetical protein